MAHPTDCATRNNDDNTASVLLENGTGVRRRKSDFATGGKPGSIAIGDVDVDGVPDLRDWELLGDNTLSVLLRERRRHLRREGRFRDGRSLARSGSAT